MAKARFLAFGAVASILMGLAAPGYAASLPATSTPGDFSFSTSEDISQTGALVVGGNTNISGNNVVLDNSGNDFSTGTFEAAGSLTGAFMAVGSGQVTAASTLFIEALDIGGSASIAAFTNTDFFDVIILNAQDLFVGGTLEIVAESILFDFSDGGTADLSRLNVGGLSLVSNMDGIADSAVIEAGVSVTTSGTPAVIPLPGSLGFAFGGTAMLAGLGFWTGRSRGAAAQPT
ncbi:MAG: hypothetical protein AAF667_14735 [Pseudomonadota bacterium]